MTLNPINLIEILKIFSTDEKSQQEENGNEQADGTRTPSHYAEPLYFTQPLVVNEGAAAPIQRWNIQVFSRYHHGSMTKGDLLFR